jgi:hypothetical protein
MRRISRSAVIGVLVGWFLMGSLLAPRMAQAATFGCGGGDVSCLSTAIVTSNSNGEVNTITLAPGTYTLTTPATLSTGLPVITSTLTILGSGPTQTTLARSTQPGTPGFRLLEVGTGGTLLLARVTLTNGTGGGGPGGGAILNRGILTVAEAILTGNHAGPGGGAAILNRGTLAVLQTTVRDNSTLAEGAGIATSSGDVTVSNSMVVHNVAGFGGGGLSVSGGRVTVKGSTFTRNISQGGGGAIENGVFASEGEVHIEQSAFTANQSETGSAAIVNWTIMEIVNTTIAANIAIGPFTDALGILNIGGTLDITNSTLTENRTTFTRQPIPALANQGGVVTLANTIIAGNTTDCTGTITSLEANLIGNPTGCAVTLQRRDRTGDPGLSVLQDNGTPGNGHYDLLPTSQALDAGKGSACPKVDQLGQRRTGPCDIGAISARKTPAALAHR